MMLSTGSLNSSSGIALDFQRLSVTMTTHHDDQRASSAMTTLLHPRLFNESDLPQQDDVNIQDLFLNTMEEVEHLSADNHQPGTIKISCMPSPVGPLLLGVQEQSLRFIYFSQPERLMEQLLRMQQQLKKPLRAAPHRLLEQAEEELSEYFAGNRQEFTVPLKAIGTPFQEKVWQALRQIPYGSTWSYEQLANQIGQPTASRAVGLANGANPISIIIPCHRVINKDGQLGGYGGGMWRKEWLLKFEQQRNLRVETS